jgi:hypothetical protein
LTFSTAIGNAAMSKRADSIAVSSPAAALVFARFFVLASPSPRNFVFTTSLSFKTAIHLYYSEFFALMAFREDTRRKIAVNTPVPKSIKMDGWI